MCREQRRLDSLARGRHSWQVSAVVSAGVECTVCHRSAIQIAESRLTLTEYQGYVNVQQPQPLLVIVYAGGCFEFRISSTTIDIDLENIIRSVLLSSRRAAVKIPG